MCECKLCGESKVRVRGFRRTKSVRWAYVDETGSVWNGSVCPPCRVAYNRGCGINSQELGPYSVLYPPKLRPCQTCKIANPNYFECDTCRNTKTEYGAYEEDMFEVLAPHTPNIGFRY